jgi:tRNA1(Val) A37 N6-methylase TrmN6
MSSINPYVTFAYSQPAEYRFSHDSVFLARRAFEFYRPGQIHNLRCLDLCSGCGILGLDFIFHARKELREEPLFFDFLEVQDIYRKHFHENSRRLAPERTRLRFVNRNYADLLSTDSLDSVTPQEEYDLILCNPPYFHASQGTLSPSEFKNRCRFFLDSDFPTLVAAIERVLAPGGSAFLLLREQRDHGWEASEKLKELVSASLRCEALEPIRGTAVFRLEKSGAKSHPVA